MEQEQLTIPENPSSPPFLMGFVLFNLYCFSFLWIVLWTIVCLFVLLSFGKALSVFPIYCSDNTFEILKHFLGAILFRCVISENFIKEVLRLYVTLSSIFTLQLWWLKLIHQVVSSMLYNIYRQHAHREINFPNNFFYYEKKN